MSVFVIPMLPSKCSSVRRFLVRHFSLRWTVSPSERYCQTLVTLKKCVFWYQVNIFIMQSDTVFATKVCRPHKIHPRAVCGPWVENPWFTVFLYFHFIELLLIHHPFCSSDIAFNISRTQVFSTLLLCLLFCLLSHFNFCVQIQYDSLLGPHNNN
jgi:hypothetical protein